MDRQVFAASEVKAADWGNLATVSRITGLARSIMNRPIWTLLR